MASPVPAGDDSAFRRAFPKILLSQTDWDRKVNIGRGSYGQIFEIQPLCASISPCAAKEIAFPVPIANNTVTKSDFFDVCRLWSMLRHPNVVQFFGIYYPSKDETGLPVMILEKMHRSVTSLLQEYDDIPLLVKLSILYDASLGLSYLHAQDPPIVHRDVSSNNILLTSYLEAKITDPLIKTLMKGNYKKTTEDVFMQNFMRINEYGMFQKFKSPTGYYIDVFSFGQVILHVITRQLPTPLWQNNPAALSQVMDMITGEFAVNLKNIVTSCLQNPLQNDQPCRPVANIALSIDTIKRTCRKKYTRDGVDPLSWLAEIKHLSLSTNVKLQVCS